MSGLGPLSGFSVVRVTEIGYDYLTPKPAPQPSPRLQGPQAWGEQNEISSCSPPSLVFHGGGTCMKHPLHLPPLPLPLASLYPFSGSPPWSPSPSEPIPVAVKAISLH